MDLKPPVLASSDPLLEPNPFQTTGEDTTVFCTVTGLSRGLGQFNEQKPTSWKYKPRTNQVRILSVSLSAAPPVSNTYFWCLSDIQRTPALPIPQPGDNKTALSNHSVISGKLLKNIHCFLKNK